MRDRQLATPLLGIVALALLGFALKSWVDPLVTESSAAPGTATMLGDVAIGLAGAGAALVFLSRDPAWAISIGLGLEIFNGNWPLAHVGLPLDRLLIAVGLLGLFLRCRRIEDAIGGQPRAIHGMLLLTAVYALFSSIFSNTIGDSASFYGLVDQFGFLPFVLFAVAPAIFPDQQRRRILLGTLTVVGAYLAYTSILGHIGPRSLVWPSYIVDPHVGIHADRARGPFVAAGGDGLGLFECGAAAVLLAATSTAYWIRRACVVIVAACALSIELTLTRSVWIASAAGLLMVMLVTSQGRRYLVPVAATAVVFVFGALAVVPGLSGEANDRVSDQRPIWDRENANGAAVRMIESRPALGFGWDTFETDNADYQRLGSDRPLTRSNIDEHNVFLATAVELGVPATILWGLSLMIAIGSALLRRGPPELNGWRIALVAIATQWLIVANFVPLAFAFPNALLWLWAGIAYGRREESATTDGADGPRHTLTIGPEGEHSWAGA